MTNWYCFTTPAQKEPAALAWLAFRGIEAWRPTETRWRNVPRGKRKKVAYEAGIIPRYIFAAFSDAPNWYALQSCRYLSGVVQVPGMPGVPRIITEGEMARMTQIPQRLADEREAKRLANVIRKGDWAKITSGALEGVAVQVIDIAGDTARISVELLGAESKIEVQRLEKHQPLA